MTGEQKQTRFVAFFKEATRRKVWVAAVAYLAICIGLIELVGGDREKALEAGCDDFDTKPVDLSRLLGKIEALLNG